jgi:hypothetical protein
LHKHLSLSLRVNVILLHWGNALSHVQKYNNVL